ncbi:phosphocholine-specific phospholipase C [Granulicella aggregans]|uniref:phosphocholine-specific phospholipase C n=1 Tax=Granulicella aggregans TaxID=474949 RepID=UPI0021E04241|nr:phospholipase C, phosphocholine-specific [Granulicella aggregans]
MQTRRDFLKLATLVTGAAGLGGLFTETVQKAYAIEAAPGSTFLDAEHVVILMQENRSFDHAFGTMRGVRGFNDPRALRQQNGNSVFVQTDAAGNSFAPWRLDIKDTRITWMGSLPHSRESQVDAWNEGLHDGWLDAKRSGEKEYAPLPLTMGHYTREDLPFYYALADAFTLCDQNYCSVMTSTSPNRSYLWTGTIREHQSVDAKVHIRNEQIDDGGMTWKTFPERLEEAGITWKSYQNELTRSGLSGEHDAWLSNFGDNVLECFSAYNVEAYPGFVLAAKQELSEISARTAKLEKRLAEQKDHAAAAKLAKELQEMRSRADAIQSTLAGAGEARYQQLSDHQKALHNAAFVTNAADPDYQTLHSLPYEEQGQPRSMEVPKGDVLYKFRKDVNEDKLPAVSWLTASERFSDHPSSPWFGAWYVSEVMDILTSNPEVWKKTIFILTYDENDGYFDHAPSFVAADPKRPQTGGASSGIDTGLEYTYKEDELRMGVEDADARSGPIGMGFRVPMIIASPWSRGGWVNSQVFDHTSVLTFLEGFVESKFGKKVREDNVSAWRRTVSGDLTSAFRPYDPNEPSMESLDRDKFVVSIEKARFKEVPSNFQKLTSEQIEEINRAPLQSSFLAKQEKGIRPACALPYELYAEGNLTADNKHFELRLTAATEVHGSRSAGAPFNVYLRNLKDSHPSGRMISSSYAVKAGDTLKTQIPLSHFGDTGYSIEVVSANGFYRSFQGRPTPPILESKAELELNRRAPTGNLQIRLKNRFEKKISVTIEDNSYKAAPIARDLHPGQDFTAVLDLKRTHGWYDFTVKAVGSSAEARYAGRVETGKPTFSDPLMGGTLEA